MCLRRRRLRLRRGTFRTAISVRAELARLQVGSFVALLRQSLLRQPRRPLIGAPLEREWRIDTQRRSAHHRSSSLTDSAFACCRIGIPESASSHSDRNWLYCFRAPALSPAAHVRRVHVRYVVSLSELVGSSDLQQRNRDLGIACGRAPYTVLRPIGSQHRHRAFQCSLGKRQAGDPRFPTFALKAADEVTELEQQDGDAEMRKAAGRARVAGAYGCGAVFSGL
jgi:hypothetical protein